MQDRLNALGIARSKVQQYLKQLIQKVEDHLNDNAVDHISSEAAFKKFFPSVQRA
jgi:hypothetical protein